MHGCWRDGKHEPGSVSPSDRTPGRLRPPSTNDSLPQFASFLTPRHPPSFGHMTSSDSLVIDGLFDVYNKCAMGNCAEHTAKKYEISREAQDDHCIESYKRVERAWAEGKFEAEIAPVTIKGKKGDTVVKEDEEYKKVFYDKVRGLRPVFQKDGTVTAANASTLNDGASAVILMTEEKVKETGVKPLAKILGKPSMTCSVHASSVTYIRSTSLMHSFRRCCGRSHGLSYRSDDRDS
jgi:acetyl-CoA acetyltransferase